LGENTERSATIYNNLGEIYRKKKDYIMAIQQYDEAVAIHERILGQGKMNES
jgi:tetratricopeptide (TPR) repeat protein